MKIRLAASADEIKLAQALRHEVFVGGQGLDGDRYDETCAHLFVIDEQSGVSPYALSDGCLVATTRLIGQREAERLGGFYSASEFDLEPLLKRQSHLKFLELGRTCILPQARGTAVMELLWQGIWDYVRQHGYDVMIGCASFEGSDPTDHAAALQFLSQHAKAPEEWQAEALPQMRAPMSAITSPAPDLKAMLKALPPLIKGYVRLGCYIGDGCVVDKVFNTVDVLIILPVRAINPRYFQRFGQPA